MLVAGIDGTKAGWVIVTITDGTVAAFASPTISAALGRLSQADAVAIDMPIGFLDSAVPGGRECEKLARQHMPGRASSVFSSPIREALNAIDYFSAAELNKQSSSHRISLSKQSSALFPKMKEVDLALRNADQDRVFEVHPELCFQLMAREVGHLGKLASKKSPDGQRQRIELLSAAGVNTSSVIDNRSALRAAMDDIIDGAAAAWTATRKVNGRAQCFPEKPPVDSMGLRMEMWA